MRALNGLIFSCYNGIKLVAQKNWKIELEKF